MSGKLGILVQSDNYFKFVENLADAAGKKDKEVRIHLIGTGVALVSYEGIKHLTQIGPVTICSDSFKKQFGNRKSWLPCAVTLVEPHHVTEIVQWSDRCVVF